MDAINKTINNQETQKKGWYAPSLEVISKDIVKSGTYIGKEQDSKGASYHVYHS